MNHLKQKKCLRCGSLMGIYLKNMTYMKKHIISDVPVHRCECCEHYELVDEIKEDLRMLLQKLDNSDVKKISFSKHYKVNKTDDKENIAYCTDMDIDSILDIYLLAKSLNDEKWMNEMKLLFEMLNKNQNK